MPTKLIINLRPKTIQDIPVGEDMTSLLEEWGAELDDLTGNIIINKDNTIITEEGHLVFVYPDKLWYAVAVEPDEFVILVEKEEDE
ncbi:MAG: hypothetical protein ACRC9H_12940 [Aeromonas veronii]